MENAKRFDVCRHPNTCIVFFSYAGVKFRKSVLLCVFVYNQWRCKCESRQSSVDSSCLGVFSCALFGNKGVFLTESVSKFWTPILWLLLACNVNTPICLHCVARRVVHPVWMGPHKRFFHWVEPRKHPLACGWRKKLLFSFTVQHCTQGNQSIEKSEPTVLHGYSIKLRLL